MAAMIGLWLSWRNDMLATKTKVGRIKVKYLGRDDLISE